MHVLLIDPDTLLVLLYRVALRACVVFFHAVIIRGQLTRQAVGNS